MATEEIDFKDLTKEIVLVFLQFYKEADVERLMELFEILSNSNYKCFEANMAAIDSRKNSDGPDNDLIANCELTARTVGEKRVYSKNMINKIVSEISGGAKDSYTSKFIDDDIIYTVGDMLDRLSIEHVKQHYYGPNDERFPTSREWSYRVKRYLSNKLSNIREKGFFETLEETRTYESNFIDKIKEEIYSRK